MKFILFEKVDTKWFYKIRSWKPKISSFNGIEIFVIEFYRAP